MKKSRGTKFLLRMALIIVLSLSMSITALADAPVDKPFLSLGADLTQEEQTKVLELMGIQEENLSQYDISYVTNGEEHEYLGEYLSDKVIGTRALSSVVVTKKEAGNGVIVDTKNIAYCTPGMYRNALITAGITDADVTVVGPFNITGTAALVGAMKVYELITGEPLSDAGKDAATNELVVTGELSENIGDTEKTEQLFASVKQSILDRNARTTKDIIKIVDDRAQELNITLTTEDRDKMVALMDKVSDLDLDTNQLKEQAKDLYDKIESMDTDGFFNKLDQWFTGLIDKIRGWF